LNAVGFEYVTMITADHMAAAAKHGRRDWGSLVII